MISGPSIPFIAGGAGSTPGGRLLSSDEARKLNSMALMKLGEMPDFEGQNAQDDQYVMPRSPGGFSTKISQAGAAVSIGEDWVGPGRTTADGGLQGCADTTPGFVFSSDGRIIMAGKRHSRTAAELYSDAGAYGDTILLALIPPRWSEAEIVYRAVHLDNPTGLNGHSEYTTKGLSESYVDHTAVPIALLSLVISGGASFVDDIYWSLQSPVIPAEKQDYHMWKLRVFYDVKDLKYEVSAGTVIDGVTWNTAAALVAAACTSPLHVWLRVKYYNDVATPDEFEIMTGSAWPETKADYSASLVLDPSNPTVIPTTGWSEDTIPLAQYDTTYGVRQWAYDAFTVPYGKTYKMRSMCDYGWSGTKLKFAMLYNTYRRGILIDTELAVEDVFDTGPCP